MNIKINNKIIWYIGINMTLAWRKKFNLDKTQTQTQTKHKPKQTQTQTKTKINFGLDSDFNSIHFGIEINKRLKLLRPKMFGSRQFQKIFLRSFKFVRIFVRNFTKIEIDTKIYNHKHIKFLYFKISLSNFQLNR